MASMFASMKSAGASAKAKAADAGAKATAQGQAWVASTAMDTKTFLEAKGWVGTVDVSLSLPLVTLHGAVPVGGAVVVEVADAPPDAAAAGGGGAEKVSEKMLEQLAGYLETAAQAWKNQGFCGGSVGADVHLTCFGVGASIGARIDVMSIRAAA